MVETSKTTQIAIRVPNEILAEIQALAKTQRRTLAAMTKLLIEDALEQYRQGQPEGKK